MKRSAKNIKYWSDIREELYEAHPESQLVKNRQKSLRAVLTRKYKWLADHPKEDIEQFLKDVHYNERKIREETEGMEEGLKKKLAQQYLVNEGL